MELICPDGIIPDSGLSGLNNIYIFTNLISTSIHGYQKKKKKEKKRKKKRKKKNRQEQEIKISRITARGKQKKIL